MNPALFICAMVAFDESKVSPKLGSAMENVGLNKTQATGALSEPLGRVIFLVGEHPWPATRRDPRRLGVDVQNQDPRSNEQ